MIEDVSNMNLKSFIIAEVKNNVDPNCEGRIAVYIPQLMYDKTYDEKPFENEFDFPVEESVILNKKDYFPDKMDLEESNYIWARPLSYFEDNDPNWKFKEKYANAGNLRIPRIGSQVMILFHGQDLQKCYYIPDMSPTVEGQKFDTDNAIKAENYSSPEARSNIDVIRFYWDKTRIEVDTNEHKIKLSSPQGYFVMIGDDLAPEHPEYQIWIKGNTYIEGKLTVENETWLKDTLTVDKETTLKSTLEVYEDAYFKACVNIAQTLNNAGIRNLTTHVHTCPGCGNTSGPHN